ncbi:MAG: FlgD immunoglobulin-like domain containing protein [Fibrobacterota bacterium]
MFSKACMVVVIVSQILFALDYSTADKYFPQDYTAEILPVSNGESLLNTAGTHTPAYQLELLKAQVAVHLYFAPRIMIASGVQRELLIQMEALISGSELDRTRGVIVTQLKPYESMLRYVINIYKRGQLVGSSYVLSSSTPVWKNVLIMADGFDPGNKRSFLNLITDPNYSRLMSTTKLFVNDQPVETPLTRGFTVCFVDFANGADDIRNNAKIFLKIIETINAQSTLKMTVGGFSMGGVVSRLALLYAEKQQLACSDNINKFISVDSPQDGAWIPMGFQSAMDFFVNHPNDYTDEQVGDLMRSSFESAIKSPAALQMLYKHVLSPNGAEHDKFYTFLANMGDYPRKPKKYAVANSNWQNPYPSLKETQNYKAATINNYDIYVTPEERLPGSSTDLFGPNVMPEGTGQAGMIGDALKLSNFFGVSHIGCTVYDPKFRPTFIPVASVFGLAKSTPSNLMDASKLSELCAAGYSKFNKLYLQSRRCEHIEFDPEYVSLIMNSLLDYGGVIPEYKSDNFVTPLSITLGNLSVLAGEHRTYNAQNDICVTTLSLRENAFVDLNASKTITFKPGFSAAAGAYLSARITNVSPNAGKMRGNASDSLDEIAGPAQLYPNLPNPFNPQTVIRYSLPGRKNMEKYGVQISIFNIAGKVVRRLVQQKQSAGLYSVAWDAKDDSGIRLPSGTYVCCLTANHYRHTLKMTVMK